METTTSRRRFLSYAGVAAVAASAAGCSSGGESAESNPPASGVQAKPIAFRGPHQPSLSAGAAAAGLVAGLDVQAETREELVEMFANLSDTIENLMAGEPFEERDGGFPAFDSGLLGDEFAATPVAILVGVGASLFDGRFGLADRKPAELQPMVKFTNDFLVKPERSDGDLSITIHGSTQQATLHAFRQILRETRGQLTARWTKEGFNHLLEDLEPGQAPARNLLGFRDGTVNPDVGDGPDMDKVVWVQPDGIEPAWAVGGTYQAIRVIRMMVEFWDRTRLNEQEEIFNRHRESGAPLGKEKETELPEFTDDSGLNSHIGRANSRKEKEEDNTNRMLRRGAFNYTDGIDENDQLDQGLVFIAYQQSLEDGFITVQKRLDGEALEEYVRPLGGGFFFVLPGVAEGERLGDGLLA